MVLSVRLCILSGRRKCLCVYRTIWDKLSWGEVSIGVGTNRVRLLACRGDTIRCCVIEPVIRALKLCVIKRK